MTLACIRSLAGVFAPAALLTLGCAPARITDDGGTGSDATGADGGASSSGSSSGGSSSGGGSSGDGSGPGSPGDGGTGTEPLPPPCAIPLSEVAQGIGGFVLDGEAEGDRSGFWVNGAGDLNGDGLADVVIGASDHNAMEIDNAGRAYVAFGKLDTEPVPLADVTAGLAGFAIDGESQHGHAGWSVSGAGDVNGDGLADVLVGTPRADPNGIDWAGRIYVVFGKAHTDKVTPESLEAGIGGFVIDGEGEHYDTGARVSSAGDVNGDGLADMIVGARSACPHDAYWAGRAYVVLGKQDTEPVSLASLQAGVDGFVLSGEVEHDNAGAAVGGAGDVNGDGFDDVLVGAPFADPNGDASGRVYVVFGSAGPESMLLEDVAQGIGGFPIDGEQLDSAGASVSGAGDVNRDGLADVILGAPFAGLGENGEEFDRAYVVLGKPDNERVPLEDVANGIGGFVIDGERGGGQSGDEIAGESVGGLGDVNGDGRSDVVVAGVGPDMEGEEVARVYVVWGKEDTDRVRMVDVAAGMGGFAMDSEGTTGGDQGGLSVAGAGDVNGDGIPDIIVGLPICNQGGMGYAGRTYVVFGGDFSCDGG
jgi:hypothetical protein